MKPAYRVPVWLLPVWLWCLALVSLATVRSGPAAKSGAMATAAEPTITLAAVGDILLDRGVAAQISRHDLGYPFQHSKSILAAAGIAFGNLECPVTVHGMKVQKRFCFKADPATVPCLAGAGLDMLSVANNHSLDCGRTGLEETMANLRANGLHWCGGGASRASAEAPHVLQVQGLKVAFVGFCEFLPEGVFLRDDKATIAFAAEAVVRRSVTAARRQADVVVASFHWGVEYTDRPTPLQIKLAHAAVDAGADLVLGHHPHVLQGLELRPHRVGGKMHQALIAYSLGNFVFDSPRGWAEAAQDTMILRCTLNRQGCVAADILPMRIYQCQPRPATAAQAQSILQHMAALSKELHTVLVGGRVAVGGLGTAPVKGPDN